MEHDSEFDIRAAANEVADLLKQHQGLAALRRLEDRRAGQPLAVQEALDRYVATDCAPYLDAMKQSASGNAISSAALVRIESARHVPRFPGAALDAHGSSIELQGLTEAQRYDIYASIVAVRGNGASNQALHRSERVILGLRDENSTLVSGDDPRTTPNEAKHPTGHGIYNDRLVVLWRDPDGTGHVQETNHANTEPTAQYDHHAGSNGRRSYSDGGADTKPHAPSPGYGHIQAPRKIEGKDVNGDGLRDLGRLAEGTFEMQRAMHPRPGGHGALDIALRPTAAAVRAGQHQLQRDSNGDGWFTAADPSGSQNLNDSVKFHRGSPSNTDSAGCQTTRFDEYPAFINTVTGNPHQTRWQYVLTSTTPGRFRDVQSHADTVPAVAPASRLAPSHAAPSPARDPSHPAHPDHAMLQQIRGHVCELDRAHGRSFDAASERTSYSLLALARERGLTRVDHVVLSEGKRSPGETIFMVQGGLRDPAHLRAHMKTDAAASTPIEDTLRQLQTRQQASGTEHVAHGMQLPEPVPRVHHVMRV